MFHHIKFVFRWECFEFPLGNIKGHLVNTVVISAQVGHVLQVFDCIFSYFTSNALIWELFAFTLIQVEKSLPPAEFLQRLGLNVF